MKLTDKSQVVFNYIKENGGRVSIDELVEALGKPARSISANITDLVKKGFVVREKVSADSEDEKDVTYAVITEAGKAYVPTDDEADA